MNGHCRAAEVEMNLLILTGYNKDYIFPNQIQLQSDDKLSMLNSDRHLVCKNNLPFFLRIIIIQELMSDLPQSWPFIDIPYHIKWNVIADRMVEELHGAMWKPER